MEKKVLLACLFCAFSLLASAQRYAGRSHTTSHGGRYSGGSSGSSHKGGHYTQSGGAAHYGHHK